MTSAFDPSLGDNRCGLLYMCPAVDRWWTPEDALRKAFFRSYSSSLLYEVGGEGAWNGRTPALVRTEVGECERARSWAGNENVDLGPGRVS